MLIMILHRPECMARGEHDGEIEAGVIQCGQCGRDPGEEEDGHYVRVEWADDHHQQMDVLARNVPVAHPPHDVRWSIAPLEPMHVRANSMA